MQVAEAYDTAMLEVIHDEILEFTPVTVAEMLNSFQASGPYTGRYYRTLAQWSRTLL
jgi:hypothetical protein